MTGVEVYQRELDRTLRESVELAPGHAGYRQGRETQEWGRQAARRIGAALNLQPGEGARVALMTVYSAASVGGVVTVGYGGVGMALFASRLPASAMPFAFLLPAPAIVVTLLLYHRLAARVNFAPLAAGSAVVLAVVGLVFRLLLASHYGGSGPVLAGLFVFCETAATLVIAQFWACAGQIFNAREARRLFGRISTGGLVSNVVAGLFLAALVHVTGVANLLLVVVAALVVCAVCAALAGRVGEGRRAVAAPRGGVAPQSMVHDLRALWGSTLVRTIALLTIAVSLFINVGTYQFLRASQAVYAGRPEALAGLLGHYNLWTGVAALVVQLFLTRRVLTRGGIFAGLLVLPSGIAVAATAGFVTGGAFWAMTLTRAAGPVLRRTINDAALNTLYLPLPADLRRRARVLLEAVYALTFALAGGVFLLMQHVPAWSYADWSLLLLGLVVCSTALLLWGRSQYVRALTESVRSRRLDPGDNGLDLSDDTTVAVLVRGLHGADEKRIVHILQLVAYEPAAVWHRHVTSLLTHPCADVRVLALRYLERNGDAEDAPSVRPLTRAADAGTRAAAIATLCALLGPAALDNVGRFLHDRDPHVRGAPIPGLLAQGGSEGAARAATALDTMLADGDPGVRREAARALGAVAGRPLDPTVLSRFGAPAGASVDPDVAAAIARSMVFRLIDLLRDRATREAAADAVVPFGVVALLPLREALQNPREERAVRVQVCHIAQRIGGRPAGETLAAQLGEPDPVIRSALCRALAHITASSADDRWVVPARRAALRDALQREIRDAYDLYVAREDLRAGGDDILLSEALRRRTDQALDRMFWLLAVTYPARGLERAQRPLAGAAPEARAMAIELLDNVLEDDLREVVIPLLEAPASHVAEIALKRFSIRRRAVAERLEEMAGSCDTWLRDCARRRGGILRLTTPRARGAAPVPSDGTSRTADAIRLYDGSGTDVSLSTIERVLFLKSVDIFRAIDAEDLLPVASVAEEVWFPAGERFIVQGGAGDCLYLVVAGEAGVVVGGVGQVAVLGPGTVLGEMAILSGEPRSADCVALTEVTALRIDRSDFWEVLAERPAVAVGVIKMLTQRLDAANRKGGQS